MQYPSAPAYWLIQHQNPSETINKLPREVWIAGVSQMGLQAKTSQLMVEAVLRILEEVITYQPDVACLPEVFLTSNIDQKLNLSEKLEASNMQ